ncbi:hypothetical protein ACFRFU_10995 [Streptomyces sp. NPDC056704]|uniref:hypothetical protein n=1 Tax=Streptomyces sp. NPDC056704 TaxID=3345917 RepID=UPI003676AC2C
MFKGIQRRLLNGKSRRPRSADFATFGNDAAQTYNVTPENANLRAANQYVNAFNALAAQLEAEGAQQKAQQGVSARGRHTQRAPLSS